VKDILGKAHHLKKLVQLYAGPDRPTARQQKVKLEAIADTLPAHVLPEMADFTKMALLSLQVLLLHLSMLQVSYNSIIALLKSNEWCWYNVQKWPTP
jgi:hypothetical protein